MSFDPLYDFFMLSDLSFVEEIQLIDNYQKKDS